MNFFLMILLAILNFIVLLILSIIHFYWALGGQWSFGDAIPTDGEGNRVLNPGAFDSFGVGLALLLFASFHLLRIGVLEFALTGWLMQSGLWVIGGIFLFRAVGDFRYFGFFKKVKNTPFASKDFKIYSPLCLWIGVVAFLIETFL